MLILVRFDVFLIFRTFRIRWISLGCAILQAAAERDLNMERFIALPRVACTRPADRKDGLTDWTEDLHPIGMRVA